MGQSPQYHNHNPHGNCNHVWNGELHVRPPLPFGHLPLYGENYPPPPPCGVLAPVSGGESVTTASTAPANCPPETGWTRSEATEGVDIKFTSNL